MNVLVSLVFNFIKEEKFKTIFIIILSCILNILKINVISFISANIIKSIQERKIDNTYIFYKYFIVVSILFIILFNFYKVLQNHLLSKLRQWLRFNIIKLLFIDNNNDLSSKNFTKLNTPTFRSSSNCFSLMTYIIDKLLPNISLLIIVFLYFIYNDLFFGSIFLVGNIILILYIYFIWNNLLDMHEKLEDSLLDNESFITEILNNFDKIIYRGESTSELNILWEKSKEVISYGYNFYKKANTNMLILNIILFIIIFILIYYLIYLFTKKNINSTIFVTFLTILLLYRDIILSSIQEIPEYIQFINRARSTNKIFENNIDYDEELKNDKNKHYKNYNLNYNSVLFKNIKYKYKNTNKYVLNNFNLKLDTNNKIIGITGISGKGKSTLAKLLIKLYKYEGDIFIDNINLKNIDPNYIRKNIIYVNQNTKLFDKKIIENIFYGCDNYESCNLYLQYIMKFKKIGELYKNVDFNKNAGLTGDNISGGQRQVINLINGLITPSKILILDEPTNALDMELKKEIIELIKYFKKHKKCIIIISHDKDIYDIFDEKIEINNII
jgi:ABC-type bacteriocin/lantibiotic exporter with double-glycine peptidase domain